MTRTPRNMRLPHAAPAVAIAAVIGLAGCSSQISGAAVKDPTVTPGEVNTALLQPGNYPTEAQPPPTPNAALAVVVDAHHLADFVVGPWEIAPALTVPNPTATLVLKDAHALTAVLLDPGAQIAETHHVINGFTTARISPKDAGPSTGLVNVVMRFPTSDDAAAAATDFTAQVPGPGPDKQPVLIPGHPEAQATQSALPDGTSVVESFTPHGPYVLYQDARAQESVDVAAALVTKTLDVQAGRIDGFTPTDPAQFAQMPLDPSGLSARTLPVDDPTVNMGVWTARGMLHFQSDPLAAGAIYGDGGVDVVSVGKTQVYQARDPAAAVTTAAKIGSFTARGRQPGPSVPALPAAKCCASTDTNSVFDRYICVAPAQRWVIMASSKQDFDATQQIAAQYLMLVGK